MDIDKINEQISNARDEELKGNYKNATAISGRVIRELKKEIKNIKKNNNPEDDIVANKLQELLDNQLEWHGKQLKGRYDREFKSAKPTLGTLLTSLPKGVGLQVKRIGNSISKLKEAKTNKERLFMLGDTAKNMGLLAATPVIYGVKHIVNYWYVFLAYAVYAFDVFGYAVNEIKDKYNPLVEYKDKSIGEHLKAIFGDVNGAVQRTKELPTQIEELAKGVAGHFNK